MPFRPSFRPFTALFLALLVAVAHLAAMGRKDDRTSPCIYVAHAGGGYQGNVHTSAIEAMKLSYANGYRIFELDVEWTTDDKVVLVHDWFTFFHFAFLNHQPTYDEYVHLRMRADFRPPTLENLAVFLKEHPDAFVIIDSKHSHVPSLRYIARHFPDMVPQVMPYIYHEREYDPVRKLGYRNLIFASYQSRMWDDRLLEIIDRHKFFAVSTPSNRADAVGAMREGDTYWSLPKELAARNVKLFVHVVNGPRVLEWARHLGVSGVLSDWLIPNKQDVQEVEPLLAEWKKNPV